MMARLRAIRLTLRQLVIVAGCSVLATGVIISSAASRKSVPSAVISAYQRRLAVQVVHSRVAAGSATTTVNATPPNTSPATVASTPPATVASAPSPSPAPAPSSSGGGTGGSSNATAGSSASGSSSSSSSGTPTGSGGSNSSPTGSSTSGTTKATYKVKHVFVIALSTSSYPAAFGHDSVARYLNGTLRHKGTLLSGYRSLGSAELPEYLAMVSGQAPNGDTQSRLLHLRGVPPRGPRPKRTARCAVADASIRTPP